jgi:hypothetical protein
VGDWYETVVDPVVSAKDAPALAEKVVAVLVAGGLVKPVRTRCTLGELGYPPSSGVLQYLKAPDEMLMRLGTNGLKVEARRSVHVPVNLERVLCPACGAFSEELSRERWQEAVGDWYEGGEGALSCPACLREASVAAWVHEPTCGFGNLACTFWNWPPFTSACWTKTPFEFIEAATGHQCVLVSGKL